MLLSEWSGFLKNASGCVQRKRTGGGKAAAELREVMGPNHSGLRSSPEASCTVRTAWISGPAGWERTGQSPKDKGTLHQLPVSVNDVNPQRLALTTGPAEPRASLPSPSVPLERRKGCLGPREVGRLNLVGRVEPQKRGMEKSLWAQLPVDNLTVA